MNQPRYAFRVGGMTNGLFGVGVAIILLTVDIAALFYVGTDIFFVLFGVSALVLLAVSIRAALREPSWVLRVNEATLEWGDSRELTVVLVNEIESISLIRGPDHEESRTATLHVRTKSGAEHDLPPYTYDGDRVISIVRAAQSRSRLCPEVSWAEGDKGSGILD